MKKSLLTLSVAVAVVFLTGCGKSGNQNVTPTGNGDETTVDTENGTNGSQTGSSAFLNSCKEEKVNLPNYGDPGKRLKNCFVEFPGEPTRQDKSYYIIEDICGQFSREFVENMLGAKITKIEPSKISTVYACSYYLNDKEYVMLALDYLKVENQKIGQEAMGRKVENNPKIPMDNFVVWQEDGAINNVYFILGPEKFLRLERSSGAALDNDNIIDLSAKLGEAIKRYK